MARRGENIYKRKDGRWEGRYIKKRKDDRTLSYGYVYAHSYKEVKEKLLNRISKQKETDPEQFDFDGTISIWIDYWLETLESKIKPSTYSSYKNKLERYIKPKIGHLRLRELTTAQLERLVEEMSVKLAPSSVRTVYQIIKSCLKEAERRHFLSAHVLEGIVLPKIAKRRVRTLSLGERQAIQKAAMQDSYGFPIILSLETGLRIGEISGLKWEDIDFNNQTLTVSRTLQRLQTFSGSDRRKTEVIEGSPKTSLSRRQVPLSSKMITRLKKMWKNSDSEYVVSINGKPMEPRTITNHFKRIAAETAVSQVNFHCLRHSFATQCLECGVSVATISSLLGHTSVKLTLDIYTNTTLSEERRAIELLAS